MDDTSEVRLRVLGDDLIVAPGPGGGLAVRPAASPADSAVPIVSLALTWEGRRSAGRRLIDWPRGHALRPIRLASTGGDALETYEFEQADDELGVRVITEWAVVADSLRGRSILINDGSTPVALATLSSVIVGGLLDATVDGSMVLRSSNAWLAEHRWSRDALTEVLPDINAGIHRQNSRGTLVDASTSTWSTARAHPGGYAEESPAGRGLGWQVESTTGWSWELGEQAGWCWVACVGPDDTRHGASVVVEPGGTHVTPWSIVSRTVGGGWQAASAQQSRARTAVRRPHPDATRPALVYNDYLNTLMADPSEEAVRGLATAAVAAGVDVYCVDAGWYDEARDGWWDAVGEWTESPTRFPGGLARLARDLEREGCRLGVWLEPEVVGVRSPVASALPESAFLSRDGHRIRENGRFFLDLSDAAARNHLDDTIDRMVAETGVGYLKFDYNVEPGVGASVPGLSPGAAIARQGKAYVEWLDRLRTRHPSLIIENCASGGMRADGEVLRLTQLQSTSDQQDFRLYAPIAANAPAAIPIVQCSNWASILPDMTTDDAAFALVTGLAGRLYLSGWLDRLPGDVRELVHEAAELYRADRALLSDSVPFWPLGLAEWTDEWIALGHHRPDGTGRLHVWHRGDSGSARIELGDRFGAEPRVEPVFPSAASGVGEHVSGTAVDVVAPPGHQARIYQITPRRFS